MARLFALDNRVAHAMCQWVCDYRNVAGRASVLFRPDLAAPIAHDGVQHTWASYSESLERLIRAANTVPIVESAGVPVRFVMGADDPVPDRDLLERLALDNDHVSLAVWPDRDHDLLLLTSPRRAVEELRSALAALQVTA